MIELSRRKQTRKFEAGEHVFLPGERSPSVFSVRSGCVKLYKLVRDGRSQIVDFLYPGDLFSVPKGIPTGYGAQAVDASELCCLSEASNESLCLRYPEVALAELEAVQGALLCAHAQLLALGQLNSLERVARFLLETASRKRGAGGGLGPVEIGLSRREMAEYLGLTVETVCRAWTELRKKGAIVAASAHSFTLVERTLLAALASGDREHVGLTQINDGAGRR